MFLKASQAQGPYTSSAVHGPAARTPKISGEHVWQRDFDVASSRSWPLSARHARWDDCTWRLRHWDDRGTAEGRERCYEHAVYGTRTHDINNHTADVTPARSPDRAPARPYHLRYSTVPIDRYCSRHEDLFTPIWKSAVHVTMTTPAREWETII